MKHCHILIICNELIFLKQKLNFLYKNFDQIIFIDYDILNNCNSKDGSLEYIENFNDTENKIVLIKFNSNDLNNIKSFNGVSMIEKRKMFAKGSIYVNDDIDIIWATDMDEFFDKKLINIVENEYINDIDLVTINIPHYIFVYNQFNIFSGENLDDTTYVCPPRITKHFKNKIYGHCNFETYGKTIKCNKEFIYHFAWVGFERIKFKNLIYKKKNNIKGLNFTRKYSALLNKKKKIINICHPNKNVKMKSIQYNKKYPDYINIEEMINELNKI